MRFKRLDIDEARAIAELQGLRVLFKEGCVALIGVRIVGLTGLNVGKKFGQRVQQWLALGPGFVLLEESSTDANMRGIRREPGSHLAGLRADVAGRPSARHNDDGRYVA